MNDIDFSESVKLSNEEIIALQCFKLVHGLLAFAQCKFVNVQMEQTSLVSQMLSQLRPLCDKSTCLIDRNGNVIQCGSFIHEIQSRVRFVTQQKTMDVKKESTKDDFFFQRHCRSFKDEILCINSNDKPHTVRKLQNGNQLISIHSPTFRGMGAQSTSPLNQTKISAVIISVECKLSVIVTFHSFDKPQLQTTSLVASQWLSSVQLLNRDSHVTIKQMTDCLYCSVIGTQLQVPTDICNVIASFAENVEESLIVNCIGPLIASEVQNAREEIALIANSHEMHAIQIARREKALSLWDTVSALIDDNVVIHVAGKGIPNKYQFFERFLCQTSTEDSNYDVQLQGGPQLIAYCETNAVIVCRQKESNNYLTCESATMYVLCRTSKRERFKIVYVFVA
jgi:hypothetical protein